MSRKADKNVGKNKNEIVIRLGLIITTIIFLLIIYNIFNRVILANDKIDLSGETYYQYFLGIMEEYSGDMKVVEKGNDTQLILEDGKVVYLDSTPMYYKDILGKALLTKDMELVFVDDGTYKLDKFTNVIMENNEIKVKKLNRTETKNVTNAFIFDGEDLYFFLEETNINIGDKTYTLSPLSYIIVNYRSNVEIYNYEKDEYTIIQDEEDLQADIIATNKYNSYNINLSIDKLSTEKREQLLISNIKNLNKFDY